MFLLGLERGGDSVDWFCHPAVPFAKCDQQLSSLITATWRAEPEELTGTLQITQ